MASSGAGPRQDHSMTANWSATLTEDRYATQGSRQLRALLAERKPGPLTDELALPAGVSVTWEGGMLRLSAAVPGLLAPVGELRKLARSPSGSAAQLDDVRLEVNNELEVPSTERTVRLPWHGWHALAQACERFVTHEPQGSRAVRFDHYNFSTGMWDPERAIANPLSGVRVEFVRLGPSKADLDLDADYRHRAEQRELGGDQRITEVDHVIELKLPWSPGGGAPEPRLWLSEHEAVLAYSVGPTGQEPGARHNRGTAVPPLPVRNVRRTGPQRPRAPALSAGPGAVRDLRSTELLIRPRQASVLDRRPGSTQARWSSERQPRCFPALHHHVPRLDL